MWKVVKKIEKTLKIALKLPKSPYFIQKTVLLENHVSGGLPVFYWGKLMDEISLFPCNIETNEATNTIISLVSVGILNKFNKM